jgi:hypothetical protein
LATFITFPFSIIQAFLKRDVRLCAQGHSGDMESIYLEMNYYIQFPCKGSLWSLFAAGPDKTSVEHTLSSGHFGQTKLSRCLRKP